MRINNTNLIIDQLPDYFSISDQSAERIKKLLGRLPNSLNGIFEFDILNKASSIDYSQAIGKTDEEKEKFHRFVEKQLKEASKDEQIVWEKIHTFSTHWIQKNYQFNKLIENIWLEFDNSNDSLPSIFFSFNKIIDKDKQLQITKSILSIFYEEKFLSSICAKICNYIKYKELEFPFLQLGLMFPRKYNQIKLVIGPVQITEINTFVARVSGMDKNRIPEFFINEFADQFVNISLDIAGNIENKFGLEFIIFNKLNAENIIKKIKYFLVNHNYIDQTGFNNILNWETCLRPSQTEQFWPDSIIFESIIGDKFTFPKIEYSVNHFKICFTGTAISQIKCYLYYRFTNRKSKTGNITVF